jgi:Leucine-rich repeat (LRR) protein
MKALKTLIISSLLLNSFSLSCSGSGGLSGIFFPDPLLEAVIRDRINKDTGDLTIDDLLQIENIVDGGSEFFKIKNLVGLQYCANITHISLWDHGFEDIGPIGQLDKLEELIISDNLFLRDISPLKNLEMINDLRLDGNSISDISSLLKNPGLGEGDVVILDGNPLSTKAISEDIPILESRGVNVIY